MHQAPPQEAGTVQVHVQVIDVESFALDMQVPTYLPVGDLTQRVARDAGLGAFWEDGTPRKFWLRARGRLLGDDERLQDLGIVPHELIHLLPQPPEGSGIEERSPEYPPNKGYAGAGNLNVLGGLVMMFAWTAGWAAALTASQGVHLGILPAVGLALLCTSMARHLWGGEGSAARIPITGFLFFVPLMVLAVLPAYLFGFATVLQAGLLAGPAFMSGMFGVMMGWLAWYGAVEPLPKVTIADVREAEAAVVLACGVCGQPVSQDVRADCIFQCGRVFHSGCYAAKQALSQAEGICAVCGFKPAG